MNEIKDLIEVENIFKDLSKDNIDYSYQINHIVSLCYRFDNPKDFLWKTLENECSRRTSHK